MTLDDPTYGAPAQIAASDATRTFARSAAGPVEAAARELARAWADGDSAFTPGTGVWTAEHAAELMEAFVGQPDMSGASFDDKLSKQLAAVSPGAVQLFAELYYLDLLPLSDYRGATKRSRIQSPLTMAGIDITLPRTLDAALDHGVMNGGVAFKTRRFWQLSYLVQCAASLLVLPTGERRELLGDPLAFRDFIDDHTTVNAPSQRFALLYLLFPSLYLPIAKGEHRAQIRTAFASLLSEPSNDHDVDLRAIYDALVSEAGGHVDLYQAPYREQWDPKALSSTTYQMDPWTRFMGWAAKVAIAHDLSATERAYKVDLARRLETVRSGLLSGDKDWAVQLREALTYGNLLDPFFRVAFFEGLEQHTEEIHQALRRFWRDEADPQLLTALQVELKPALPQGITPGNATALGAVLMMERDSAQFPPYRPTPVDKARALTEQPASGTSPAERYDDLLTICDEVLDRSADFGIELADRLDAQGLIWAVVSYPPPEVWPANERSAFVAWRGEAVADDPAGMTARAWLVRGNNINGNDMVPSWLDKGQVTLAASTLREVEEGIDRSELKVIVDEDYAHSSYSARAEWLDDFHNFLSRMSSGHLIATISDARLHVGRITGPATYIASDEGRAYLRREVAWVGSSEGVDYADLSPGLASRLRVPRNVLDLTQELPELEALVAAEGDAAPLPSPIQLTLPNATKELAGRLHVDRAWLQECIDLLQDRPQLIYYGPPGTGKTFIAQALAEHLAGDNVRLVQFHPAYSYEDFFEGYRPVPSGGFELRPGPMRKVVDAARENPDVPHVLIIDEINRGNLAKVFGELYFLLEYRDRNVDLLYAADDDQGFTLPRNVFVIGTMNTADRSIALVDAAMRRRFAFVPLHPAESPTSDVLRSWLASEGYPARVADLLDELNARIEDTDFQIGPSYFMRHAVHAPGGLDRTWRTAILPLLEEHHYGELSREQVASRYGLDAISGRVNGRRQTDEALERDEQVAVHATSDPD